MKPNTRSSNEQGAQILESNEALGKLHHFSLLVCLLITKANKNLVKNKDFYGAPTLEMGGKIEPKIALKDLHLKRGQQLWLAAFGALFIRRPLKKGGGTLMKISEKLLGGGVVQF